MDIQNYIEEFQIMSGKKMPNRVVDFFQNKEFFRFLGMQLEDTVLKKTKWKGSFHIDFRRMLIVSNHCSSYYDHETNGKYFIPLFLLQGELGAIGLLTGDKNYELYFFGQEIKSFRYKDGVSKTGFSLEEFLGESQKKSSSPKNRDKKPKTQNQKKISKQSLDRYLENFERVMGFQIPKKIYQFFHKDLNQILGKNMARFLTGYNYNSRAIAELNLKKMNLLIESMNDGYFGSDKFLPLVSIRDQTACICLNLKNKNPVVYFFDFQDGIFKQKYTLDQLFTHLTKDQPNV